MKIKHYAIFDNNDKTLNWENLRNDEKQSPYFLPYTKSEYLKKVDTTGPSEITHAIIREIETLGLKNLFSIGAGLGAQEYQIKKFSGMNVIVSDYNSTVLRLKEFAVFDDAIVLDAFRDPFPVDNSYIVLFPRIDTEFEDEQLTALFKKCADLGIKHICFIPAQLISRAVVLGEIKVMILSMLKMKKRVFCGYSRSKSDFIRLWGPYYKISKEINNDHNVFFLQSIK